MIYLSGPGHGGNAMVAQSYLEGTYSEVYPNITKDEEGLKNYLNNFLSLGEYLHMLHQKRLVQLMRVVN